MSLNKKVPYTSRTKPSTWSHLKVSQPRPRETIQMKSVRQVSIVLRAVADKLRVTLSPKKLKPLRKMSETVFESQDHHTSLTQSRS
jgi:hypothetical protein